MQIEFNIRSADDARYAAECMRYVVLAYEAELPPMSARARWDARVAGAAVHGPHAGQPGEMA